MHKVTLQPGGQVFEVQEGESVLAAALRSGLPLPYGCKDGACGSCKGRVLAGTVDYGHYHVRALSDAERAHGKALFCQAKPLSDLVLEVRNVGALKGIEIKMLPARVQTIERRAPDVAVVTLKLPANQPLKYVAGQYIDFLLKDGARRSFSMANPPHVQGEIELHIRHVPGGSFTERVFNQMKEREILRFEGPHGSFFLREDSAKPAVFVASGTGFAPIKAILEDAFHKKITRPMVLYWGGRRPRDLYLNELPLKWAAEQPHFRYVPVISDALAEDAWSGRTGFVHLAVMQDFADLAGHQVYACGVPVMVEAAQRDFIAQRGLPEDEFFCDSFTTQADLAREEVR